MNAPGLLLETHVLIIGANVAAACVLATLAGLVLRRCLARRSLALQHGVLMAAVALLLLAPACLVISAGVPGLGIEWPVDTAAPAAARIPIDLPEDGSASDARGGQAEAPVSVPSDATLSVDEFPLVFEPSGLGREWTNPANDVAAIPEPQPVKPTLEDDRDATHESAPAVAPMVVMESEPIVEDNASTTVAREWGPRRAGSILLLVWGVGAAAGLIRCVCGLLLVARLRRRARRPDHPGIELLAGSVCVELGLRRIPQVLLSDHVDVPLTLGLLRPAIVLPADLANASEARLRGIFLHEAAHVARRDLWAGLLQRIVGALYWWNPLVHRLNRRLNDVRESLCDNHVLLAGEDVRDYADTLLTLAARIARPARAASVLGLVGRPSPGLSGRVTHLLTEDRDMSITLNARTCRLLAITTLGILCGLTLAAVRAPAVATEADTATPMRFSEVREHVLSIGSLKFLLDLDTDETMDPPARNRIEQAQMDIHPAQQQPSERPTGLLCDSSFLTGSPLRGIRVTPADWNTSASELQDTFASDTAQPLTELEYQANESATYFFRTSDGTDGILQLMEIIENSPDLVGRDTQGIRVRYKVLEAVAEAETSQADGTTKPLDRQASEREHSSEPAETEMLAPREPLAESDVAALLVVSRDETSRQMTESVEWRPCVAVRAVFDCLENSRRLARRLGRSRTDVTEELQIIDFELQRQSWAEGESEWSGWQPVDIAYARELLQRSAGFDDDSVAAGARDAAITMPLPARAIGEWDASLVTHPAIRAEPAEGPDEGAGDELLLRYLDFDVTGGNRIRYRMRIEFGVARETVWTDWSEPTREVTVPAAGDGVQRGLLDVSRSIVRIETAVDGELRSGSGVLVTGSAAKEHGMQSILTSAHLLNGFDAGRHVLNVQLFDEVTPRTRALDYVSIEEDAGLALLCFSDLEQNLPTASIAPLQRRPDVGDDATFHWWIDGRLPAMFSTHRVVAVDRYAGPSNLECTGLPQPGQPSGGLFNARLELIGICVAADPEAGRGVFTALPAILEFLDIDGEPADERRAPQPASPTNPYGLPVTGSPIGLSGPPHVPVGGPGPGALHPADVESTVILIALGADDAGALTDIHYLTELLGTGDDAVDALTTRLAAAAEESAAAQRALHVQISVDPRLKYASVARIMDVCREQGAADVRLALLRPDDDFVINIGFVRDGEGRKLSETPVVFWEDRVRGVDDLSGILRTERQQRPGADVTVVLRADSDVPGGVIQDVIRQAQEAGFEKFVLRVLHADAHPPELHGTVLEVMETSGGVVVQISIGHDDGLRRGDRLDVLRGDSVVNRERVGLIEITHVSAEHSVARVLEFQADAPIARGDQIVAGTDSRYPRNLSRLIPVGDEHPLAIQLHIQESAGLQVHWTDPVSGESEHLTAPCRVNVTPGLLALTLTDIPGRSGLLLRSTIETPVATPATSAWLEHNAVPIELTDEDFAQVESGNFVVKVIYLPNPGLRETAVAGVETLVSTRLDPGVDPVEEAEQRGTVLAVVRLGSRAEP